MEYLWAQEVQGQFVDGHEWEDIVIYHQGVFLQHWKKLEPTMHKCGDADLEELPPWPKMCHTVIWHHDESTFYANDWHVNHWIHKAEKPKPYAKGEGTLEMVVDLVSADYRWLQSPDGKEEERVLF